MLKLFKYEGFRLNISEEAILLKPIKDVWDRDTSEAKDRAFQELGYIYFFCDPRSDFQSIVDEDSRRDAIIKATGMPEDWQPDEKVKKAMTFYSSFKPMSALLLEDTRVAVDKLRTMLRESNYDERDDKGKPVHTISSITSTIKMIPGLVRDLNEAEKAINKDIIEEGKVRGSQTKSLYEDMI